MRELTSGELELISGGDGADASTAIIGTAMVAVAIAASPAVVPLAACAVLGAACGVAIGMAWDA